MDITSMSPRTGRMVKEDGTIVNIANVLSQGSAPVSSQKIPIHAMSPITGRFVREDGSIVNIAELIEQFVASGGGSVTPEQIQAAVDAYLTQNPVQPGATQEQAQQIEENRQNIENKLDKNQGAENSGKFLSVDEDGNVTPKEVPSGGGTTDYVPIKRVYHGTADTTFILPSNETHVWDEVQNLDITLAEGTEGVVNLYVFWFISGSTPSHVIVKTPDGEEVKGIIEIQPNSKYQITIEENCAACGRWDV